MEETQRQPQTQRQPLRRSVRPVPQEILQRKMRIKIWMGASMIIVALCIDAFQAILNVLAIGEVLSTIISIGATTLFMVWFWILGLGFIKSPKKFAAMGVQAIVGLIPILNTLPELTLAILAIVWMTRSEDKGGLLGKAVSLTQARVKS